MMPKTPQIPFDLSHVKGEITISPKGKYTHCYRCDKPTVAIEYNLANPDNVPSDVFGGVCKEHEALGVTATFETHAALMNGKRAFELEAENKQIESGTKLTMVHELLTALGRDGAYTDPPAVVWQGALDEIAAMVAG